MTGTDKCKLLVIGKSIKPQFFKNIDVGSLPITHHANKNAWMTSQLFTEWLTEWDSRLDRENQKTFLLVDNCTAHSKVSTLKNIQLEFLPHNTTSLIQPMDQEIIKNLKSFYQKKLCA